MAISLSGSLEITGSINATGGITGSFSGTATSASYALIATSASYAANATSASYAANSDLLDSRDSLTFANTGSNSFVGTQNINGAVAITGSLTTTGAITAQTLNVQQVTSSIVYSSGSNVFGNSVSNTQSMTGSVGISGSLAVTGGTTITGVLTLNSTITNGTYTYTLPSATGTLALTSALSGYLPLTGGTLTGALSGTSASFSSTGFFGSDIFTYVNGGIFFNGLSSYTSGIFQQSGGALALQTGGTPRLTIASTGAATFSSTIDATRFISNVTNNYGVVLNRTAVTTYNGLSLQTAGTPKWFLGMRENLSSNNYIIYSEQIATDVLKLDVSTGAATFSSSIAATSATFSGALKIQTAANSTNAINFGTSGTNYHTITYDDATGKLNFNTDGTTRAVTFSNSNVGIGTPSPTEKLHIYGSTSFLTSKLENAQASSYSLYQSKSGTGGLWQWGSWNDGSYRVGVSGVADYLTIASTGAAKFSANINAVTAFEFSNTNNTSGNGNLVSLLGSNCNNTSSYHLIAATGGADKFYLYGNGTYTTVSDRRLKKNISTIQDTFLDKVLKLNIVNYQWNDQTDNDALELGMIAQEVEEIIPSIVHEGREDDNGNKYKGIQASVLPYILIKAIQEQQAQIEALKLLIK